MKLQENNGQYHINIPKTKIKSAGWKKGEELDINIDTRTGELIIKKI